MKHASEILPQPCHDLVGCGNTKFPQGRGWLNVRSPISSAPAQIRLQKGAAPVRK